MKVIKTGYCIIIIITKIKKLRDNAIFSTLYLYSLFQNYRHLHSLTFVAPAVAIKNATNKITKRIVLQYLIK